MRMHSLLQKVLVSVILVALSGIIPEMLKAIQDSGRYASTEVHAMRLMELQERFYKAEIEKEIGVEFEDVTLEEALSHIARETGLKLTYRGDSMVDKKVTLQRENISVSNALALVLEGTGLDYKFSGDGYLLIAGADEIGEDVSYQETVSGLVTDSQTGESLPGVNVVIEGTTTGTSTNLDGEFEITVPSLDAILIVSYIGYQTQQVSIDGVTELNIELISQVYSGSELIVIGYGTREARDVTGSISQVRSEDIEQVPVSNFQQTLKGRASGIQVNQNTGAPGARTEVRIRGGNSMIGSNDPLYVVDGFPVTGGIDHINPSDIESLDILKDASATAIYGARGANGVILVTTKTGRMEQPSQVSLHSYFGFQTDALARLEVLNAEQYATIANEYLRNEGHEPFFVIDPGAGTVTDGFGNVTDLAGIDWQDAAYRAPSPIQRHTVTFSGGSEHTRYSMSLNYFDQEGIVFNSGAKRGGLRLNLDHQVHDRVNLNARLNLTRSDIQSVPVDNRNLHEILGLTPPPTLSVFDENGLPRRIQHSYFFGSEDMENPASIRAPYKDRNLTNSILGNSALEFELSEGLILRTMFGLEYEQLRNEGFEPIIYSDDRGSASERNASINSFLNENTLNYNVALGEGHRLDAVGGLTYQSYQSRFVNVSVVDLPGNITQNFDLGSASQINPPSSGISEWTLLSGLGRVNYSFDDRYLATISFRADGSSRFGDDNKWGFFPSAALAWRISSESFMNDIDFLNDLKFRASYGITGNTALSPYQSLSRLTTARTVFGGRSDFIGFVPANIANPELKWETTTQIDAGFDLSLFHGLLNFNFDYYKKITANLLASVPLPTSSGYNSVLRNIGEIHNEGIEFSVFATPFTGEFRWDINAHYSNNNSVVAHLAEGADILGGGLGNPFQASINIAREGEPFGAFYGFREDGIDPETGQRILVDQDGDGIITGDDRVILGSPHPDFMFSLNNTFFYKNLSLSVFLDGVFGHELYWAESAPMLNSYQRGHNQLADFWGNYWTEENPNNAKYPKLSSETFVVNSDKFLHDASYLRVKSVTLTYDLPVSSISLFNRAQIYVSADNLFTFTKYPGRDPHVNTFGSDSGNVANRLRMGIDGGGYPTARTFTVGTRIDF